MVVFYQQVKQGRRYRLLKRECVCGGGGGGVVSNVGLKKRGRSVVGGGLSTKANRKK